MNIDALRKFKDDFVRRPVFGPFAKTCDPAIIEILGHAGFDFVILDMEHGPSGIETLQNLIRAAELTGILPIVRVTPGDHEQISKVLDVGAAGIQIPHIASAEDVKKALQAAKFSPRGKRGVCRYVRAAGYSSVEKSKYFRNANEALFIVQIEGRAALDHLESILNVEGIDIVFVGPYDLSQSLGVPGQIDNPIVVEKIIQIVDACVAKGIVIGNFTETPQQTAMWIERGLRYMAVSVDMGIIYEAARSLVSGLKRCGEKTPS